VTAVKQLVRVGAVFLVTALIANLAQFFARSYIARTLGIEAAGQFQAAWSVSSLYLGFLLGAMTVDYYPRLSEFMARGKEAVNTLANDQAAVILHAGGPVILLILAFAPLIINVLYTRSFADAIPILRWQTMGDLLKLGSWVMRFILLADGRPRLFLLAEVIWGSSYVGAFVVSVHLWGVTGAGIAFGFSYLVYCLFVWAAVRKTVCFEWSPGNRRHLGAIGGASVLVLVVCEASALAGMVVGGAMAGAFAIHSVRHLRLARPGATARDAAPSTKR
jgi:enterobacterial common antigen flippase